MGYIFTHWHMIKIEYEVALCSVAAQCPIPSHMAMHGDMGGNGTGEAETLEVKKAPSRIMK